MQNAGTVFKVEKVSCRLQGRFSTIKSPLAKCRGSFQHQKVPLQNARSFFAAKQAPRKSQEKILKARGRHVVFAPVIRCFGENCRCDIDFATFHILPVPSSLSAKWRCVKIGSLTCFLRAHHARNSTPPLCALLTRSQRHQIFPPLFLLGHAPNSERCI